MCRRYRPCTQMYIWYIWLHFYRLIDICVHRISILFFVFFFHFLFLTLTAGRPFLPLKSFAGGQSFVKRRGRPLLVGSTKMSWCHAHMPHMPHTWIPLEADVFLASEDGETLLDENGKTVLGAFECGAFTIYIIFTCFTCIDSPDENVPL